jgi:hypothetical protein
MIEACTCEAPGWCDRHRRDMPDHLLGLCRTREEYRRHFDEMAALIEKSCTDWERIENFHATEKHPALFVCKDCLRGRVAASIEALPKNRPCWPPVGVCGNWEQVGSDGDRKLFRCPTCQARHAAQDAGDLPTQRPCYPPRPRPESVKSTSCCGGACKIVPPVSVAQT